MIDIYHTEMWNKNDCRIKNDEATTKPCINQSK